MSKIKNTLINNTNVDNDLVLKKIKQVVTETLKRKGVIGSAIYVFGSRARNQFNKDSDYDILIIVNEKLSSKNKLKIYGKIIWNLRGLFNSFDIVIKSKKDYEEEKNIIGSLIYGIKDEAIAL